MDKTSLIKRISTIEGLTNEERSALLELLRSHKKYGLVWENKVEDVEERLRDELPILREVKDKYIPSDFPNAPNHILIEGDNLEALTALSYTHEGKIDVIYIDPPYNTGNKDFVYNDSYVDSEDSYRHSKWLSFINKRLKIAKRLLSDKGVILISINNIECSQLKLLCDEIFSERNLVGHLTWESTTQPTNAGSARFGLQQKVESVLMYAKCKLNINGYNLKELDNGLNYPHKGKFGACRLEIIEKSDAGAYNRESMKFPIMGHYPRDGKRWQIGLATAEDLVKRGRIEIVDGIVKRAVYPEDEIDKRSYEPFWSHFDAQTYGTAQSGKDELNTIMGKPVGFDTVKPVELMSKLLFHTSTSSSTILDFFAGSGTTLHATMQLNAEDGGQRKCILVTNNENFICEEITYKRNKRVINGYTTPKGVEVEGLNGNSLRYYKTDFISRVRTQRNMRQLVNAATDMLCIKEDLYTEQQVLGRWKMIPQVARYFSDGKKHMLVVYNEQAASKLAEMIEQIDFGGEKIKIYIFSPERYAFDDEFYEVQDKVQLVALPAAIYDAYQKVLPKRRPQMLDVVEEKKVIPQDLFAEEEGGEA